MLRARHPAALALAAAALALAAPLRAQPKKGDEPTRSLAGSWSATAMSESWTFTEWGEACGPKPASKGAGGGGVTITEVGSELQMSGAGRGFSTADCWEQLPGLSRASHSASKRAWSTRCTSPAGDPRRAAIVTTISATDTSIVIRETGTYEFHIEDTACKASVVRSRSLSRPAEAAPAPSATAKPAKEEPRRCTSAGEPARLELSPSKKLLRRGESFTFRGVVLDAEGCGTGVRPAFSLEGPAELVAKARVGAGGKLEVDADAPEGTLQVVAAHGGKTVTASVQVTDPSRYEQLLVGSGLDEQGEASAPSVAVLAVGGAGGEPTQAEDLSKQRRQLFLLVVGGAVAVLAFAGLVIVRRGRRREEADGPTSGRAREAEAPAEPAPADDAEPASGADAEAPPAEAPPAEPPRPRGKVCPSCGTRYGPDATFCGADGTSLVPLN